MQNVVVVSHSVVMLGMSIEVGQCCRQALPRCEDNTECWGCPTAMDTAAGRSCKSA